MPIVNHTTRIITCKLVYYGPGGSGKSSNLTHLYGSLPAHETGELTSFANRRERSLKFEYMPAGLGSVGPYQVQFEICTAPGQSNYQASRESLINGADGIAFIADSRIDSLDGNLSCLRDLHATLVAQGVSSQSLPFVFQYNKQNLPADEIATVQELSAALNVRNLPAFAANAVSGEGVIETLQSLATQLLRHLGAASGATAPVAEIDFDNLDFEMEHVETPHTRAAA